MLCNVTDTLLAQVKTTEAYELIGEENIFLRNEDLITVPFDRNLVFGLFSGQNNFNVKIPCFGE